ncbi:hypothetical protein GCM10023231_09710 [Olivibacter ginsenosidimutans]|uniref:Uncharacterized protein n=1 Tax=Olivibacter ginsenosidimutans TaxID=1176537 RepID=A0ABP9AQZ4_9SPHI
MSLRILLDVLEGQFVLSVSVVPLAKAVFQIQIPKHDLVLLFYCNLFANVVHQTVSIPSRVIHIDEDLFLQKKAIIINRISAALQRAQRIYARNTQLSRINKEEAIGFQQAYHLQVHLPGKYRYGLFYRDELVAIAVFSSGRKMNDRPTNYRSFELLRFCQQSNFLIVGGLSKLLKGMIRQFHPGDIMTYVDRDWSNGEIYVQLGFNRSGSTSPQRFYIHGSTGLRYDTKAYRELIVGDSAKQAKDFHTTENLGSIKMHYRVEP